MTKKKCAKMGGQVDPRKMHIFTPVTYFNMQNDKIEMTKLINLIFKL